MKDIKEIVQKVIFKYLSDNRIDHNSIDIEKMVLSKYLSHEQMYDLEVMLEDEFFNGEDLIPDGYYDKVSDLINFLKIETSLREEEPIDETKDEEIDTELIKIIIYNNTGFLKKKSQTIEIKDKETISQITKILNKR